MLKTLRILPSLLPVLLAILHLASAGPGQQQRYANQHSNYGDMERNKQHIQEHLKQISQEDQTPPKPPTTEKEELYFIFTLHDYNKDGYLDGHELRSAFTDFEGKDTPTMSLEEVVDMVDHVLEEDDKDGDGRISWEEYMASQFYHGVG
ncbi:hypothetical protein BC936DRAFT_146780 [Jimgerdemannia flammicorona]|uniref:Uncharacterized protein n=2 Tax=Jimgerdemannia flammicorona TaxID=994334 RepID=A0A433DLR8_9FUNG|nr:hypothetical protein BC936DRAFT_146780 [Jimgerdemannia flammicorona]RUS30567.1 hypothetical protein BC938DRAFT_479241 [Jimgerdemannia flammicorona]